MGLFTKIKKFSGSIGKAVGTLTGSEAVGRATSMAVGGVAGSSGYSSIERQQTQAENSITKAQELQNIETVKNEQIAEQTRLKLLAEADLQQQAEEQRKRTTFAGAAMQGISERRKLLGV
jgi:hypothetical protein